MKVFTIAIQVLSVLAVLEPIAGQVIRGGANPSRNLFPARDLESEPIAGQELPEHLRDPSRKLQPWYIPSWQLSF